MTVPKGSTVDSGVLLPAGLPMHSLERRKLEKKPFLKFRIFDPQLYLSTLNPHTCRDACAKLASYPWFGAANLPVFDSEEQNQAEWKRNAQQTVDAHWKGMVPTAADEVEDAIRSCVTFQERMKVQAIVLPSPLTVEMHGDYATECQWLDIGLMQAKTIAANLPAWATVAISDTCLRAVSPWANPMLDTIVDQLTSRAPAGVYIVVDQASEDGYYITNPNTIGSILRLVHELKVGGIKSVFVSLPGVAGLLALCAGADAWAAGWYRSERRLRLADFEPAEGRAVPAYYSHALAAEFHTEHDLDRAVSGGMLHQIADETNASTGLLRALRQGLKVELVKEWRHGINNVAASIAHFHFAMQRESLHIQALDPPQRLAYADNWLEKATKIADVVRPFPQRNARTAVSHQAGWLAAFAAFKQHR